MQMEREIKHVLMTFADSNPRHYYLEIKTSKFLPAYGSADLFILFFNLKESQINTEGNETHSNLTELERSQTYENNRNVEIRNVLITKS